jgi:hypothetical protein
MYTLSSSCHCLLILPRVVIPLILPQHPPCPPTVIFPPPSLILTPSSSFLPSLSLPLLTLPSVRGQIAFATDIFVVQTFAVKLDKQQQVYRSPAESTFLESSGFEPEVEMDTITNHLNWLMKK